MAIPTKTIVTQTYEGETITCAKFSCTETSDFKFDDPVQDNNASYNLEPGKEGKSSEVNLNDIYKMLYVEPVSAKYDPETKKATQDVTGVSFDLAAAKKAYDAAE